MVAISIVLLVLGALSSGILAYMVASGSENNPLALVVLNGFMFGAMAWPWICGMPKGWAIAMTIVSVVLDSVAIIIGVRKRTPH